MNTKNNKETVFSLFTGGIKNTTPNKEINITTIIKTLKNTKFKHIIDKVRSKEVSKNSLSYVTFAGVFSKRNNKGLISPSGYLSIDFDDLEDLESTKKNLMSDDYIHLLFVSPSGKGLKAVVKIPLIYSNNEYKSYFLGVSKHFNIQGFDEIVSDISRACYLSHDADTYYNPNSMVFSDKVDVSIGNDGGVSNISELVGVISPYYSVGNRQMLTFYLSGVLRQKGFGVSHVEGVIKELMKKNNDSDLNRLSVVKSTFDKDVDDLKGHSGLKELLPVKAYEDAVRIINTPISVSGLDVDDLLSQGMSFFDVFNGDFPPISWRIPGIIMNNGSFTFLAGEGGKFKTYLSIFMIRSLLTGQPFLDHADVKMGKVLYLDEESGRARMKDRLRKVMKGYEDVINGDDFLFYDFSGKFCFDDEGMVRLEKVLASFCPDVVFIDSLTRHFLGKENSADETKIILNYLKGLYVKYNCAFVIIHHFNKNQDAGNRLRGSSELIAAPDVIVVVEEVAKDKYKFYHEKLRDGVKHDVKHFDVVDKDGGGLDIVFSGTTKLDVKFNSFDSAKRKVRDYLFDENLVGKEIRTVVLVDAGVVGKNTAKKVLDSLCKEGVLRFKKLGVYDVLSNGLNDEELSEDDLK